MLSKCVTDFYYYVNIVKFKATNCTMWVKNRRVQGPNIYVDSAPPRYTAFWRNGSDTQWWLLYYYDRNGANILFMTTVVLHLYLCWQMVPHLYDYNAISLRVTVWNLPISNCLYHFNCENQVITEILTTPPPRHQRNHYSRHSHDYAFHRCIINDPLQSSSPCYVYHHYILHLQDNDYFVFYNECCSNVIPSFHPPSKIYLWLHFKEHV